MPSISVVVVCKNAEATIARTLASALALTTDVIVMDTGSTDNTLSLLAQFPVRKYESDWLGYGPTKNKAAQLANNQWILSLDADEWLDEPTIKALQALPLQNEKKVFAFKRINYINNQALYHGHWGRDKVLRLYNKSHIKWNNARVHEKLEGNDMDMALIKGNIHHFTAVDLASFTQKQLDYARLMAQRYIERGKKPSLLKLIVSPLFSFLNNYIIRLGFLDGYYGYVSARLQAQYTFWKYLFLQNNK